MMMRFNSTARRLYLAPALGLVLVTAIAACSSSSSSSTSTTPSTPASTSASAAASSTPAASGGSSSAETEISTNWNKFFSSSTPNSERVQLLENGSQFSAAISGLASSPLAARVTSQR